MITSTKLVSHYSHAIALILLMVPLVSTAMNRDQDLEISIIPHRSMIVTFVEDQNHHQEVRQAYRAAKENCKACRATFVLSLLTTCFSCSRFTLQQASLLDYYGPDVSTFLASGAGVFVLSASGLGWYRNAIRAQEARDELEIIEITEKYKKD